jgi:serine/threonine protein kinase
VSASSSREINIFLAAIEKDSHEQLAAYLDEACGEDEKLRARVEALVAAHQGEHSFLERRPGQLDGTVAAMVDTGNVADVDRDVLEAGLAPAFVLDEAVVAGDAGHSVLKSLGKRLASVPRVTLRDSGDEQRVVKPKSKELPHEENESRYRIDGEIARGGMGAILKGRDTDLGRDLAIKVLLDSHKDNPEVVERFVEEAQIGGQLQHPGIVPVYELGQFSDERPFFSMKLVKGKTLASLLAQRKAPGDDHAHLLGIFEQVCQTMAYAHSRGVIHRDLKPANVMVGAFGEVQVMDWGLAKVLAEGGTADEQRSLDRHQDVSIIRTQRSTGSDTPGAVGSQTNVGSVMGTPAYMPPEQALGETDRLDERADVFGLGAILSEILTGKPPYIGRDSTDILRQATRGKLEDCFARLDASGVDAELVLLAKRSLAAEPEERLPNAGVVADELTEYLNGVQDRLKEAEIETARAQARRKLYVAIAGLMLVIAAGATAAATNFRHQREVQAILAQDNKTLAADNDLKRREAETQRNKTQRLLYASDMKLAYQAWSEGHLSRAVSLLRRHLPNPGGEDLRRFEWYHIWHACQAGFDTPTLDNGRHPLGFAFTDQGSLISRSMDLLESWDLRTHVQTSSHEFSGDISRCAAFSPDRTVVATGHPYTERRWRSA